MYSRLKRNFAIAGGVSASIILSPVIAGLAVSKYNSRIVMFQVVNDMLPSNITYCMAEWIERSYRSREVAGSGPGHAKQKVFKLVLAVQDLLARCQDN